MNARSTGFRRLVVAVVGLALVGGACTSESDDGPGAAATGGVATEAAVGAW